MWSERSGLLWPPDFFFFFAVDTSTRCEKKERGPSSSTTPSVMRARVEERFVFGHASPGVWTPLRARRSNRFSVLAPLEHAGQIFFLAASGGRTDKERKWGGGHTKKQKLGRGLCEKKRAKYPVAVTCKIE